MEGERRPVTALAVYYFVIILLHISLLCSAADGSKL